MATFMDEHGKAVYTEFSPVRTAYETPESLQ